VQSLLEGKAEDVARFRQKAFDERLAKVESLAANNAKLLTSATHSTLG
jgi:hypothetical protein